MWSLVQDLKQCGLEPSAVVSGRDLKDYEPFVVFAICWIRTPLCVLEAVPF